MSRQRRFMVWFLVLAAVSVIIWLAAGSAMNSGTENNANLTVYDDTDAIIGFIKIELYFWYKTRESFKELRRAYKDLKKSREDLHNLLKDKELDK